MTETLRKPWLVAIWPGMGGVAQIAGTYLVQRLGGERVAEIAMEGYYQPTSIQVKKGLVQPTEMPRSVFYACRAPAAERDLLVMLADRQPADTTLTYSNAVLDVALEHGVECVYTFAAMATPIHPSADPRVFGVCTRAGLLPELAQHGTTLLEEGEISGLNGLFIAAAEARGLPSACLLGEFPFFAVNAPNPKASVAVLRVYCAISGVAVDLRDLQSEARKMERNLVRHLEKLQQTAQGELEAPALPQVEAEARPEKPVNLEIHARIEGLFEAARSDRGKALELKRELDQRGLFRQYEDRFLDLFKQGG